MRGERHRLPAARGSPAATRSSARRPPTIRHPGRSCARADDGTHSHNTLSADADNTAVQVFYPFHPLHGATRLILRRPQRGDGAVCVMDPAGRRLKIPVWMLLPGCAGIRISRRPHLGKEALLSLASLIASQLAFKDRVHDNLLQTPVSGCEGGRRGATSISGPDDPKGMRRRANGGSDTRRSDRSHGPSSGSGLSQATTGLRSDSTGGPVNVTYMMVADEDAAPCRCRGRRHQEARVAAHAAPQLRHAFAGTYASCERWRKIESSISLMVPFETATYLWLPKIVSG